MDRCETTSSARHEPRDRHRRHWLHFSRTLGLGQRDDKLLGEYWSHRGDQSGQQESYPSGGFDDDVFRPLVKIRRPFHYHPRADYWRHLLRHVWHDCRHRYRLFISFGFVFLKIRFSIFLTSNRFVQFAIYWPEFVEKFARPRLLHFLLSGNTKWWADYWK